MEVLAVGVEVAILAVMAGLSNMTEFVLFSVRVTVFVDVFVQAWGIHPSSVGLVGDLSSVVLF